MDLVAIIHYYNIPASSAKHMLETLSEEKKEEIKKAYWEYAERKFKNE